MKRSYHLFEIKGLNQERFFNQAAKKYHLFEINRQQKNTASFKVDFKDRKKPAEGCWVPVLKSHLKKAADCFFYCQSFLFVMV